MGHSVPLGKYLVGFLLAVLFQEGAGDNIARYPPSKPTTTGQVWLRYCRGIESIFELNFCDMLPCGTRMDRVYQAEKYMCVSTRRDGSYMRGYSCEEWSQASWLTHPGYKEGYYPLWSSYKEIQKGISLTRRLYGYKEVWSNNGLAVKGESIFIKLRADLLIPENRSHKTDKGLVFLMLRADTYGEDLKVVIHLSGVACGPNKFPSRGTYDSLGAPHLSPPPVVHPNGGTHEEYWEVKTGELDQNMWLKWMNYTARAQGKTNCIICAAGRPSLTTAPARITPHNSPQGFVCLLELFVDGHIPGCSIAIKSRLNNMYPQTPIRSIPPRFEVNLTPDYHCITGRGTGRKVGSFPLDSCNTTREIKLLSNMTRARSDIWWFCGGQILRGVLPFEFSGTCAIIQLIMPIYILPDSKTVMDLTLSSSGGLPDLTRRKREYAPVPGSFDKNIYIDTIGVPRGVPNEHKARNQIAAGFESVLFWWSTINKNVDWINYIYYNQQRFVNFTEEAVKGLSEQLDATSRMTYQNRLALDMLLAERGGVCGMIGTTCCTFIPNNTAPDGSVARALAGLQSLKLELAENSGIGDPIAGWMENLFGRWRGMIQSVLIAGIMAVAVLVVVGCCCIPCARGLLNRLITTAVGATEVPGDIHAYVGIRYNQLNLNEIPPEEPEPIQLQYIE
jgi:hypothetical protein